MSTDFDLESALEWMRKARPLVHNITNDAVMNVTANAVRFLDALASLSPKELAAGAKIRRA